MCSCWWASSPTRSAKAVPAVATDPKTRRAGRTFALCLLSLIGLLGLDFYAVEKAADSLLLVAAAFAVSMPLGWWICGKAWASAMIAVAHIFGK